MHHTVRHTMLKCVDVNSFPSWLLSTAFIYALTHTQHNLEISLPPFQYTLSFRKGEKCERFLAALSAVFVSTQSQAYRRNYRKYVLWKTSALVDHWLFPFGPQAALLFSFSSAVHCWPFERFDWSRSLKPPENGKLVKRVAGEKKKLRHQK